MNPKNTNHAVIQRYSTGGASMNTLQRYFLFLIVVIVVAVVVVSKKSDFYVHESCIMQNKLKCIYIGERLLIIATPGK